MERGSTGAVPAECSWRNVSLFFISLAIVTACLLILRPFAPAIVGAIVLAVVTHRPHVWLSRKIRGRTSSASVTLLLTTLSIIVPSLLLARIIVQYAMTAASLLQNGTVARAMDSFLDRYPQLVATAQHNSDLLDLGQVAQKAAEFLAGSFVSALGSSVAALTQIIMMLFLLFFLYRDEKKGRQFLSTLLPLAQSETRYLLRRIDETIRATFLGHFIVAAIQGLVAAIIFGALGIHDAAILGVLTALVAIVPYFGAYVVWLPVAVYFAMTGQWFKMGILMALGSLIISTLDNFLYPVLVGVRLRQHTVSIFLSLLGGAWLFGVAGLVLGPVIFSVAESLLTIWKCRLDGSMVTSPEEADSDIPG